MCLAVRTDKAWLFNSARLLKKRVHRTPSGARWWGMVRVLNREIGIPLKRAGQAADAILTSRVATNRIRIAATTDGGVALTVDLTRFHSTANAALAAALAFGQSRARGRPRKRSVSDGDGEGNGRPVRPRRWAARQLRRQKRGGAAPLSFCGTLWPVPTDPEAFP